MTITKWHKERFNRILVPFIFVFIYNSNERFSTCHIIGINADDYNRYGKRIYWFFNEFPN